MRRKDGDLLPTEAEVLRIASNLADEGKPKWHGWRMGQFLEDQAQREMGFGSLYRTLNRLADRGYLRSEWAPPDKQGLPPRRLYSITGEGVRALATARRTPVSEKLVARFAL
jgi:DNA-binding PadR family transcriptional regulator